MNCSTDNSQLHISGVKGHLPASQVPDTGAYLDHWFSGNKPITNLQAGSNSATLQVNGTPSRDRTMANTSLTDPDENLRQPQLFLRGPLKLINGEGKSCTPTGGVRKALLALLVLSESHSRGRSQLQYILWENSSESQGAASLRNALCVLRRELRDGLGFDPIEADGQAIYIDASRFRIDIHEQLPVDKATVSTQHGELLEGLNLRGAGGEEFEDWLREQRSLWCRSILCPPVSHSVPTGSIEVLPSTEIDSLFSNKSPATTSSHIGVGLLPVVVLSGGAPGTLFGVSVLDAVAMDLATLSQIQIYDYRDGASETFGPNDGPGPMLLLRVRLSLESDQFSLHLSAHMAISQQLVVGGSVTGELNSSLSVDHYAVSGFIAQNVDRILNWLARSDNVHRTPANTPYHALNSMFRFDSDGPNIAEGMLRQAAGEQDAPIYQGLLAYLETFRIGEHWRQHDAETCSRTRELVGQALSNNPLEGITLFAAGHALGYILHDYPIAGDVLRRSVRLAPTQAICWDHLALHNLYLGDYKQAMESANRAIGLGAFSPMRFTYETTICMIATLTGDYPRAVYYGQRALSRRPQFGAALRYMAVSLSHLDRLDESRAIVDRLLQLDPTFSMNWVNEDRLALTDQNAKHRICTALQRVGVQ